MPSNCDQINEAVRNTRTVLVFGATGKQGGAVAAALKSEGWQVRALVRNLDSARAKALVLSGVQIFQGDFADVEAIRTAMAGVHGVFSVQPYSGSASSDITDAEEVRFGKSIADIAVETGVRHFVYSSAGILSKGRTGLPNLDCKIEIEDHIRSLQMASTIVRPSTFMDLFVLTGMGLDSGVFSFFLRPEQRAQLIAVEDIGKVVATIFGNTDRYTNRTIEIAGDEVSGIDLQEVLSKAAGRLIVYEHFSDALLEGNPFLRRNAALFDEGRATENADIAALQSEFGHFFSLREWLAGPGKMPLLATLSAEDQSVALR